MNRLLVPKIITLLIFLALVTRLYQLQFTPTDSDELRFVGEIHTTRYLPVTPLRGEIFASDGRTLLAESMPIYTVAVRPADLPPPGSPERARVFAHLGQLLDLASTLTISPATVLDDDPFLRDDIRSGLGQVTLDSMQLRTAVGDSLSATLGPELYAAAATLVRLHPDTVIMLPQDEPIAARVPIGQSANVTVTLVISPALALQEQPALREDVVRLLGQATLDTLEAPFAMTWLTMRVPPKYSPAALQLSWSYSTTVTLTSPIEQRVRNVNLPGYQTLAIKEGVSHEVALVVRENADSLPGVVIDQNFRRRYPLSDSVQSFSHILGYIGRVNECELVRRNPARSWTVGLLDSLGHAVECGLIRKEINPYQLGIPRYLANDRIGKEGIETSYEDVLRGQMGIEQVLVDAYGRPVRAPEMRQEARDGDNLILTIDAALQQQVEQILRNWIAEGERRRETQPDKFAYKRDYRPIQSGVAIVMEVKTGRILAMVSWPSYDDNIWVDPARVSELQELLSPPPDQVRELQMLAPLTNRAVFGQYPPGSTLKQFTALIALQDEVIKPDTKLRDPGRLIVEDQFVQGRFYTYVNSSSRDNGMIDVSDALKVSSNIFFMSIAGGNKAGVRNLKPEEQIIERGLNIDRLANGMELFGFGTRSGIGLAGESPGRVPTPAWKQQVMRSAWTTGDTYNAAIGQGNLEVTPLQLVAASAAVANGGYLYRPQIVRGIQDAETGLIREIPPELVRKIDINPEYFQVVHEGMRRSVTEGLNHAARDECSGLQMAGKTGTAEFGPEIEVPAPDGKGTILVRQSHSWFVGFAPYDDPQIQVLVLSEGTGDLNDGSATIAVPAVTQIMQAYFGVVPPSPLPRGCQQNLPPLPKRLAPEQLVRLSYEISDPRDRR